MKHLFKRKIIAKALLCILWLGIIFYNGTREGEISQRSSKEVVKVVSRFINIPSATTDTPNVKSKSLNYYIRKNGHFFEYLILSVLLCAVVRQFKLNKSSEILLLLFLMLLFPVIDESIQKYIPGRTSNTFDIIIDFAGGILGMIISKIGYKINKKQPVQL